MGVPDDSSTVSVKDDSWSIYTCLIFEFNSLDLKMSASEVVKNFQVSIAPSWSDFGEQNKITLY